LVYRKKKLALLVVGVTLLTGANETNAYRQMATKIFNNCSGRTMISGYESQGASCDSCHYSNSDKQQYNRGNYDYFCPAANPTPAPNMAPIANAGGPYNGTQNMSVTFDGNGSKDTDGSIKAYSWDFGDGSSGSGVTTTHSYMQTGTYNLTLRVTDDAGDSATDQTTVTIGAGNQAPVASTSGPYSAMLGEAVQLDASSSTDTDGSITSYIWSFGDGSSGNGVRPTHSYSSQGTYNVTLTVTDNDGAVDSVMTNVTINPANQPPIADPGDAYFANDGEAVMFDGSGSSDPDGSIVSYAWNFGDSVSSTEMNPSHTYAAAGNYTVSLTVTDNQGLTGTAMTAVTIGSVVSQQAPVAQVNGPYSGSVMVSVNFSGNGSVDPDGTIVSYEWDFGDGETIFDSSDSASHVYSQSGSYTVTLKVTDNDGLMDMETTTATIGMGNLAPVADARGPYKGNEERAIKFNGSRSSDQDGSIVNYLWDFGDGTSDSSSNPYMEHSYASPGVYNVTLTVTDNTGAKDADSTTVLVVPKELVWSGSVGGDFLLILTLLALSLSAYGRKGVLERDEVN
jgi:PKD repeat protein